MDGSDDQTRIVKKLEERKDHLEQVKQSYRRAQDALPFVQQSLELTNWELRAHKERPPESAEIPTPTSPEQLEQGNQSLKGLYRELDVPEKQFLFSGTSTTTSSASMTFSYIGRIRDLGTPESIKYGDKFIAEYHTLQDAQERSLQVRSLLARLGSPNIFQRFDGAWASIQGFRSGSRARTAAANDVRNLLSGVKGHHWNMARRWPEENMSWDSMASRLALNGGSGREHGLLSAEQAKHSSLLDRLADVLKDREGGSTTDLESIWAEVLDHLVTILGLIGE